MTSITETAKDEELEKLAQQYRIDIGGLVSPSEAFKAGFRKSESLRSVQWPSELLDEIDYIISELKDHGRSDTNRLGGFHTAGEAFCGFATRVERFRARLKRVMTGK